MVRLLLLTHNFAKYFTAIWLLRPQKPKREPTRCHHREFRGAVLPICHRCAHRREANGAVLSPGHDRAVPCNKVGFKSFATTGN